ncbi:MAG: DUF262 domain-containing protein [Leptospiraceae bacterium]|nr:DUF262 domain-containing protein [Leptospiraceae bacterium]
MSKTIDINPSKNPEVGTIYVNDLFNKFEISFVIPDYQRPYTWNEKHLLDLMNDWKDHFFIENKFNENSIEYYFGTIMVHKSDEIYEIIDGQQRLTTLLIMDFIWNEENSILKKENFKFNYNSNISIKNIKQNRNYLKGFKDSNTSEYFNEILKKLVFSVIITDSEDKSFVFFETQNNRGVPLDEVDFFKSFHLRELKTNSKYLQYFAKKFDQINSFYSSNKNKGVYAKTLNDLFIKQFWILRSWSKNKLIFPDRRLILNSFQKDTKTFGSIDEVKLYPSSNNSLGTSLFFNQEMKPEIRSTIKLYGAESIDIPFTINQPIQRGIGFFLYTEKYASLNNYLFINNQIEEIKQINLIIPKLYNLYFVNLYQSAVVLYYDKFGREKIEEFAKLFEHYLGAFRMNRLSIVEQSSIVLLREYGNILLDIWHGYLPGEILEILKSYIMENYYSDFRYDYNYETKQNIILDKFGNKLTNARQNYYQIIYEFYNNSIVNNNIQLTEKRNWINASLNK